MPLSVRPVQSAERNRHRWSVYAEVSCKIAVPTLVAGAVLTTLGLRFDLPELSGLGFCFIGGDLLAMGFVAWRHQAACEKLKKAFEKQRTQAKKEFVLRTEASFDYPWGKPPTQEEYEAKMAKACERLPKPLPEWFSYAAYGLATVSVVSFGSLLLWKGLGAERLGLALGSFTLLAPLAVAGEVRKKDRKVIKRRVDEVVTWWLEYRYSGWMNVARRFKEHVRILRLLDEEDVDQLREFTALRRLVMNGQRDDLSDLPPSIKRLEVAVHRPDSAESLNLPRLQKARFNMLSLNGLAALSHLELRSLAVGAGINWHEGVPYVGKVQTLNVSQAPAVCLPVRHLGVNTITWRAWLQLTKDASLHTLEVKKWKGCFTKAQITAMDGCTFKRMGKGVKEKERAVKITEYATLHDEEGPILVTRGK